MDYSRSSYHNYHNEGRTILYYSPDVGHFEPHKNQLHQNFLKNNNSTLEHGIDAIPQIQKFHNTTKIPNQKTMSFSTLNRRPTKPPPDPPKKKAENFGNTWSPKSSYTPAPAYSSTLQPSRPKNHNHTHIVSSYRYVKKTPDSSPETYLQPMKLNKNPTPQRPHSHALPKFLPPFSSKRPSSQSKVYDNYNTYNLNNSNNVTNTTPYIPVRRDSLNAYKYDAPIKIKFQDRFNFPDTRKLPPPEPFDTSEKTFFSDFVREHTDINIASSNYYKIENPPMAKFNQTSDYMYHYGTQKSYI